MAPFSGQRTLLKNLPAAIGHLHRHMKSSKANQALRSSIRSDSISKTLVLFRNFLRYNHSSIGSFSLLYALKACIRRSSSNEGKQVHGLIVKLGFEPIIFLQTSLINLYSTLGNVADAHHMFDEITLRNVVCWTSLISAYVDNQKPRAALRLFRQMQKDNVEPDEVTLTVVLSACADLGDLDMGERIHSYVRSNPRLERDLCLSNALISMYAKCGDIRNSKFLFDGVREKDVTTWTSMIVGHALNGQAEEALRLFSEMKEANMGRRTTGGSFILPNEITFLGVLMACSHAGMVDKGKQLMRSMSEDYGLQPRLPHFGCMVDLLCRAGLLKEAYQFILEMPMQPNFMLWRMLLGACSLHGDIQLGEKVRKHLIDLGSHHHGDHVIMSNIFAAKGMWDRKMSIRDQMKPRRKDSRLQFNQGAAELMELYGK